MAGLFVVPFIYAYPAGLNTLPAVRLASPPGSLGPDFHASDTSHLLFSGLDDLARFQPRTSQAIPCQGF